MKEVELDPRAEEAEQREAYGDDSLRVRDSQHEKAEGGASGENHTN